MSGYLMWIMCATTIHNYSLTVIVLLTHHYCYCSWLFRVIFFCYRTFARFINIVSMHIFKRHNLILVVLRITVFFKPFDVSPTSQHALHHSRERMTVGQLMFWSLHISDFPQQLQYVTNGRVILESNQYLKLF